MFSKRLVNISSNHSSINCWSQKIIQRNETNFYKNSPTNTPRVFHVEAKWKRPFPCRFNMEYTWCVCRVSVSLRWMIFWLQQLIEEWLLEILTRSLEITLACVIFYSTIFIKLGRQSLTTESLISYTVSVFVSFASYTAKNISKFLR